MFFLFNASLNPFWLEMICFLSQASDEGLSPHLHFPYWALSPLYTSPNHPLARYQTRRNSPMPWSLRDYSHLPIHRVPMETQLTPPYASYSNYPLQLYSSSFLFPACSLLRDQA